MSLYTLLRRFAADCHPAVVNKYNPSAGALISIVLTDRPSIRGTATALLGDSLFHLTVQASSYHGASHPSMIPIIAGAVRSEQFARVELKREMSLRAGKRGKEGRNHSYHVSNVASSFLYYWTTNSPAFESVFTASAMVVLVQHNHRRP